MRRHRKMETTELTKTKRTHRVGSITFGVLLVLFGSLFLLHVFVPALQYTMIFRLWPCIFILLGLEVLVSSRKEGTTYTYDGMAIFLTMLLTFFACVMAFLEYGMEQGYWQIFFHSF